jgi:hypothetical protein
VVSAALIELVESYKERLRVVGALKVIFAPRPKIALQLAHGVVITDCSKRYIELPLIS